MKFRSFAVACLVSFGLMTSPSWATTLPVSFLRAVQLTDSGTEIFQAVAKVLGRRYSRTPVLRLRAELMEHNREFGTLLPITERLDEISIEAFQTLRREGRLSRFPYEPPVSQSSPQEYTQQIRRISEDMDFFYRSINESEMRILYNYLRSTDSRLHEAFELVPLRAHTNFLIIN